LNNFEEQVAAMLTGDTPGGNLSGLPAQEKSIIQVDIKEVSYYLALTIQDLLYV
jgi:hypothetical protein